jgi:hypothetical protein
VKVIVEVKVQHVHAGGSGWEPWILEVEATSRKAVSNSLDSIIDFFSEHCINESWKTGGARVLSAKESKSAVVEDYLELRDGKVSRQDG